MSNQGASPPPGRDDEDFFSSNSFEEGDVFDPDAALTGDDPSPPRPSTTTTQPPQAPPGDEPLRLVGESGRRARRTDDQAIARMIERSEQELSSRKRVERTEPDLADPERLAEEADERREAIATWILLALIGLLTVTGWVTWRNGGVLDLRNPGAMVAVALGKEPPRTDGPLLSGSTAALPVERPTAPSEIPLVIQDMELAMAQPTEDLTLLFLEGHIRNTSTHGWRRIEVEVVGTDAQGQERFRLQLPAGTVLSRSELATLRTTSRMERAYEDVRRRVSELAIQPGQQTRFSAVFLPVEGVEPHQISWHAEVIGAQAQVEDACWVSTGRAPPEGPSEDEDPVIEDEAAEPILPESDDAP